MKKSILNIGSALHKAEQKEINGGVGLAPPCTNPSGNPCDPYAGQFLGNPACNSNEVCIRVGTWGQCLCDD